MNTNELHEAAVSYARRGWRVIPLHTFAEGLCTCDEPNCGSPAKHPLTGNGVLAATTDETIIEGWWAEADIANVGIATGNGLLVLDIDQKGDGVVSLARLEAQHGKLPHTPTVATGGGGRHYFFKLPDGVKIGNRAGIASGIDVRGDAGYVVAVPSLHASGQRYQWSVPPDVPLADAPAWLMTMLVDARSASVGTPKPITGKSNGVKLTMQGTTTDLTTHSGVGEGERNATLCKLIGVHLARGEDVEGIEPLAMAWAEKCSPPLEQHEVVRTLTSLATKHQRTTPANTAVEPPGDDGTDELDTMRLPEPPQWPTLDETALYGVVGEIVRLLEPETEADPVGILLSMLVLFGNAVGRQPHYPIEGDHHHANLFAIMVGDSSRGRKGTSLGRTLSLFDTADADWKRDCHTTGLSSGEGLIFAVRDPAETMEAVKEKGKVTGYQKVVKDHGVTDKRLLVVEPEFAQTLKVLKREGNTLSPVIRQAWDSGSLNILTKTNAARASETHISILGHITRPELSSSISDTDCYNGFGNRFLWALVRRSKLLPDGGNALDLTPLKQRLATALSRAKAIAAMSRSADARALWHQLYPELTAEKPGLYGAVVGRGEAQTLRLSMLYALLDGQAMIGTAHLRAAVAVWRYCESSARIIFAEGQGEAADPLEQLLLQHIRSEAGINRRGLHKAIGGHLPAKEMVEALARLRDRGQVRCEQAATGGRPSERWYPASPPKPTIMPTVAAGEAMTTQEQVAATRPPTALHVEPTPPKLTLPEFFDAVNAVGGKFRHDGQKVVLEASGHAISPALLAAVEEHQAWLAMTYPPRSGVSNGLAEINNGHELTAEEFFAELQP